MENIVINISADTTGLTSLVDQLKSVGQISEQDAAKFKALGAASSKAVNDAKTPLTQLNQTLKETGASVVKAFAVDTINGVAKTTQGFISLRQQIKEATNDAVSLARQFGELSPQAVQAQKKVALLKEELSDTQKRVAALNPEAKFTAFTQSVQGVAGAFSVLTGAIQLFGGSTKEAEEIAKKFQGALNITQGLNSITGLADTFKNLKAVLGITTTATTAATTATTGLTVATVAEGAATEGATVATKSFTAALLANPITLVVAAVAALAAAYLILADDTETASQAQDRYNKLFKEREEKLGAAASQVTERYVKEVNYRAESERQFAITTAKSSEELEKKLSEIEQRRAKAVITFVNGQKKLGFELSSDLQSQYDTALKIINDSTVKELKAREDREKVIQAATEKAKKESEAKRQEALKNFATQSIDDNEKAQAIILDDLEIAKQKELEAEELSAAEKILVDIKYLEEKKKLYENNPVFGFDPVKIKALDVDLAKANSALRQQALKDKKETDDALSAQQKKFDDDTLKQQQEIRQASSALQKEQEKELLQDLQEIKNIFFQSNIDELEESKNAILAADEEEINSLKRKYEEGHLSKKKYDAQLKVLEDKKAADTKKIDAEIAEQKRKQAIANKIIALFNIAIHTAESVMTTTAELGIFGLPAIPAIIALGAIQAGIVAAAPLPKLHKGRLAQGNSNEELAVVRRDETIFDPQQSREYAPTFRAIYHKQIRPSILNDYVTYKLKNNNTTTTIDYGRLANEIAWAMRDQKNVRLMNADEIGEVISKHIPQSDPRKW